MDENNEYTEIWLNDEEAKLEGEELFAVAVKKEAMQNFVRGKDPDGLKKAMQIEHALNRKHKETEQRKNGRSKR